MWLTIHKVTISSTCQISNIYPFYTFKLFFLSFFLYFFFLLFPCLPLFFDIIFWVFHIIFIYTYIIKKQEYIYLYIQLLLLLSYRESYSSRLYGTSNRKRDRDRGGGGTMDPPLPSRTATPPHQHVVYSVVFGRKTEQNGEEMGRKNWGRLSIDRFSYFMGTLVNVRE